MSAIKNTFSTLVVVILLCGAARGETHAVAGVVHVETPDGSSFPISGVRLTLTCRSQTATTIMSDEQGRFKFANVPDGICSVVTDVQGFKAKTAPLKHAGIDQVDLQISLQLEPLYSALTVARQIRTEPNANDKRQDRRTSTQVPAELTSRTSCRTSFGRPR